MAQTEGTRPPLLSPEVQATLVLQEHLEGLLMRHADYELAPRLVSFRTLLEERDWSMSGITLSSQLGGQPGEPVVPALLGILVKAGEYYSPKKWDTEYTQLQRDLEGFTDPESKATHAQIHIEVFGFDRLNDIQACSALIFRLMEQDIIADPAAAENYVLNKIVDEAKSYHALAEEVGRKIGRLFVQDEITDYHRQIAKYAAEKAQAYLDKLNQQKELQEERNRFLLLQQDNVPTGNEQSDFSTAEAPTSTEHVDGFNDNVTMINPTKTTPKVLKWRTKNPK